MPRNLKVIPWQNISFKKKNCSSFESLKVLPLLYTLEIKKRDSENCRVSYPSPAPNFWAQIACWFDQVVVTFILNHHHAGKIPKTSPYTTCLKSWTNKNFQVQDKAHNWEKVIHIPWMRSRTHCWGRSHSYKL